MSTLLTFLASSFLLGVKLPQLARRLRRLARVVACADSQCPQIRIANCPARCERDSDFERNQACWDRFHQDGDGPTSWQAEISLKVRSQLARRHEIAGKCDGAYTWRKIAKMAQLAEAVENAMSRLTGTALNATRGRPSAPNVDASFAGARYT